MKHTYIYDEGQWTAEGFYFDENEARYEVYGETSVIREREHRRLEGFMDVSFSQPSRFTNSYKIYYGKSPDLMEWESFNPGLGTLKGKFVTNGNTITSSYTSNDGSVTGWEILIQEKSGLYKNVGVCYVNNKKLSSWCVVLKKR